VTLTDGINNFTEKHTLQPDANDLVVSSQLNAESIFISTTKLMHIKVMVYDALGAVLKTT
jgi:hypothetical protein